MRWLFGVAALWRPDFSAVERATPAPDATQSIDAANRKKSRLPIKPTAYAELP
jgi:hypothetical protein